MTRSARVACLLGSLSLLLVALPSAGRDPSPPDKSEKAQKTELVEKATPPELPPAGKSTAPNRSASEPQAPAATKIQPAPAPKQASVKSAQDLTVAPGQRGSMTLRGGDLDAVTGARLRQGRSVVSGFGLELAAGNPQQRNLAIQVPTGAKPGSYEVELLQGNSSVSVPAKLIVPAAKAARQAPAQAPPGAAAQRIQQPGPKTAASEAAAPPSARAGPAQGLEAAKSAQARSDAAAGGVLAAQERLQARAEAAAAQRAEAAASKTRTEQTERAAQMEGPPSRMRADEIMKKDAGRAGPATRIDQLPIAEFEALEAESEIVAPFDPTPGPGQLVVHLGLNPNNSINVVRGVMHELSIRIDWPPGTSRPDTSVIVQTFGNNPSDAVDTRWDDLSGDETADWPSTALTKDLLVTPHTDAALGAYGFVLRGTSPLGPLQETMFQINVVSGGGINPVGRPDDADPGDPPDDEPPAPDGPATEIVSVVFDPNPVYMGESSTATVTLDGVSDGSHYIVHRTITTSNVTESAWVPAGQWIFSYQVDSLTPPGTADPYNYPINTRLHHAGDTPTDQLDVELATLQVTRTEPEGVEPGGDLTFETYLEARFQNAKCANCHSFAPGGAKFEAHNGTNFNVANNEADAFVGNSANCEGCHGPGAAGGAPKVTNWHAPPPAMRWTTTTTNICDLVKSNMSVAQLEGHLTGDDLLVVWAVEQMNQQGVWNANVEAWLETDGQPCD